MNSIVCYAVLSEMWETKKYDVVQILVHFFASAVCEANIFEIRLDSDREQICSEVRSRYHITINSHVLTVILNRALSLGLVTKKPYGFDINAKQIEKYQIRQYSDDEDDILKNLLLSIIQHISDAYSIEIDEDTCVNALINVIADLNELSDQELRQYCEDTEDKHRIEYLVADYVLNVCANDKDQFEFLIRCYLGLAFAKSIPCYEYIYSGKRLRTRNLTLYADTKFLYRLLGYEGKYRQKACLDLLSMLSSSDARIKVYGHTIQEMQNTIDVAAGVIEQGTYDPSIDSDVCKYFVNHGYSAFDVRTISSSLVDTLGNHGIGEGKNPKVDEYRQYQPDRDELSRNIAYSYHRSTDLEKIKDDMLIANDVESIIKTIVNRNGETPRQLSDVTHLFMTTNVALTAAAKYYQEHTLREVAYPIAVADWYLGMQYWLQNPGQVRSIASRNMLCNCLAILKPDEEQYRRVILAANRLRRDGVLGPAQYKIALSEAFNTYYLSELVGRNNQISDDTLIEHINNYTEEKVRERTDALNKVIDEQDRQLNENRKDSDRLNKKQGRVVFVVSKVLLAVAGLLLLLIYDSITAEKELSSNVIIRLVLLAIPSILDFAAPVKNFTRKIVQRLLY